MADNLMLHLLYVLTGILDNPNDSIVVHNPEQYRNTAKPE